MATIVALMSCEKMDIGTGSNGSDSKSANLILKVVNTDAGCETRADGEYWSRLNFVVYQNGSKVASKNQTAGDEGYGQAALTLAEGTYQVLVLAHSSNGNPSLSSPEKIQFTNETGFTDTFFSYTDITVTNEPQTHEITLERATAMLRFIINDDMPENVRSMLFYYTGGSGALDAKTGFGCVASKQKVTVNVNPATMTKPYTFELYTIPRDQTAKLNLTVTAYDESQAVVLERVFKDVDVEKNKITEFAGIFFTSANPDDNPGDDEGGNQPPTQDTFLISANTKWADTISLSY